MKRLLTISLLMGAAFFFSGCTKVLMEINPDGSGTWQLGLEIDFETLQSLDDGSGETSSNDEFLAALNEGEVITDEETGLSARAENRLENGKRWLYVIIDVPDIESWASIPEANDNLNPPEEPAEDDFAMPSAEVDEDTYLYPTITINGNTMLIEVNAPPPVEFLEEDEFGLNVFFTPSYEINVPGEIIDTNGEIDSLTGNPVFFIDPSSTDPVYFFVEVAIE